MKTLLMIIAAILVVSGWLAAFAAWPNGKFNEKHNRLPTILFVSGLFVDLISMLIKTAP